MNFLVTNYFSHSINRARKQEVSEKDLNRNKINQKILDAILDDDEDEFINLISQNISIDSDPNGFFQLDDYKFPNILQDHPTYASLCAFFGSEKCFNSLSSLLPGGCESEQMKKLDGLNRSPVHFACAGGNLNILRQLEQFGYDLSSSDKSDCTPSCYAAMFGHLQIFQYLWTKGAEIIAPFTFDMACLYGNINIVKFLYETVLPTLETEKGNKMINGYYWFRLTPLHHACASGCAELVDYLLTIDDVVNKQINACDKRGHTPLTYACYYGSLGAVKSLIKTGKVGLKEKKNDFSRRNIRKKKHLPLVDAASCGHLDIVNFLLKQKGISINEEDANHVCALQAAINSNHESIAKLLLKNGAASDFDENKIVDLFMLAIQSKSIEITKALDEYLEIPYSKALPNNSNENSAKLTCGDKFMQQACVLESIELCSFLLSKKCNFKNVDFASNVCNEWSPFMDFLIDNGFDPSVPNTERSYPYIVMTISSGNLKRVKKMISKGAELNSEIISKFNCVSLSCERGKLDLFNFLMDFNPVINDILYCIDCCVRGFFMTKNRKNGGKKFLYMLEKVIETQKFDIKENMDVPVIKHSVSAAASKNALEILQLFDKFGFEFDHCQLNFTKMKTVEHLKIYRFLEQHGCQFDCPKNHILVKKYSSALDSLFGEDHLRPICFEVIEFLLRFSDKNDILNVKNSHGNIVNNLMLLNYPKLILNVFQICGSVIMPIGFSKDEFDDWVNKTKNKELIEFVNK